MWRTTPGRKSANRIAPRRVAEHSSHWFVCFKCSLDDHTMSVFWGIFINGYSVEDPPFIRGPASKLQFCAVFGIGQDTMGYEEREKAYAYC